MQSNVDTQTKNLQRTLFGERYAGATLAKIRNIDHGAGGQISQWLAESPRNFLILLGSPGTGKTYFCSAMLERLPKNVRFVRAYNEKDLLRRIRQSFSDPSSGDYITYLQSMIDDDLIIIDDFGCSGHTDWREEILFEAIDYRYSKKMPTIITSNLTREEIFSTYGKRIGSRLFSKENLVINFDDFDLRQEGL